MKLKHAAACLGIGLAAAAPTPKDHARHGGSGRSKPLNNVQVGPRPYYLVDNMEEGALKEKLQSCSEDALRTSSFSISHRGAPLMFPEHSKEGYMAAARMGAGIIECDVSFTADLELVCRHSHCDLHYTTDILARPELAAKCAQGFVPYDAATGRDASAKCCTSDITLAEFKSLCAEMEATTFHAVNASQHMGRIGSTPGWRTDLYAYSCAEPLSLGEHIALVDGYRLNFTAEAKPPEVPMPFRGHYTQRHFAQHIVDTFVAAAIPADRVWLQSFLPDDIDYWLAHTPAFGRQAVFLDPHASLRSSSSSSSSSEEEEEDDDSTLAALAALAARGVTTIAPPLAQLITLDPARRRIVPSRYARAARRAGLRIFAWSFDRSPPRGLDRGGDDDYYRSVADLVRRDGDEFVVLDVVARDVGVAKVFADWPGTVTYYANCLGLG